MKRKIVIIALFLFTVLPMIMAQKPDGAKKFDHEQFRKKLELFITEEAGLSPEDASKFFPLFHEMKMKQMKIGNKIKKLKKNPLDDDDRDDDDDDDEEEDDWAEAVIEIEELKVKQAQIGETYIKRLCKTISGEKVFKALKAEDAFHRQMLNNFRKGHR